MIESTVRSPGVPAVLDDPMRNRGTAFTTKEREALGLAGRLPTAVLSLEEQARRAYQQLERRPDDLARNVYLEQLHDRNEVLYYRVLSDHLPEMLPIVYDPTVGDAIERYSDVSTRGASLLPPVENLRASSASTAVAVARAAVADGVATRKLDNPIQAVQDAMWQPVYPKGDA